MGVRHWLMMITMVIGAALLLAACNSPGEPFEYRDLKATAATFNGVASISGCELLSLLADVTN